MAAETQVPLPPVVETPAAQAPAASPAVPVKAVVAETPTKAAASPLPAPTKAAVRKPRVAKAPARTAPKVKPAVKAVATPVAPAKAAPVKAPARSVKKPLKTPTSKAAPVSRPLPQTKDKTMANQAFDFVAPFKTAFADLQGKAKDAYEKSTVSLTEANDFAKGNVEAMVESGKILATGLQELGATALTDSKTAFETMTSEIKSLASAKSPTEFFQLQSALLRKHFDTAVAQTSKSTEAMLKLANDSMAPLSNRVTVAVEKVTKVA